MNPTNYILSKNPTKRSFILNADVAALPELLPKLAKLGCRNLYGFGKNQSVYEMPLCTQIKYEVNDKRNCHFPDNFFDIIVDASGDEDNERIKEYHRIMTDDALLILRLKEGFWATFSQIQKESNQLLRIPTELNIVVSTKGIQEGIRYTTDIMKKRLEDYGIKANLRSGRICHIY